MHADTDATEYLPVAQALQAVDPVLLLVVDPAGQAAHTEAPLLAEEYPAVHKTQTPELIAPEVVDEADPALQSVQADTWVVE